MRTKQGFCIHARDIQLYMVRGSSAHILDSHVHTSIVFGPWTHLRTHLGLTSTHTYFLDSSAHTFWTHTCTQTFFWTHMCTQMTGDYHLGFGGWGKGLGLGVGFVEVLGGGTRGLGVRWGGGGLGATLESLKFWRLGQGDLGVSSMQVLRGWDKVTWGSPASTSTLLLLLLLAHGRHH